MTISIFNQLLTLRTYLFAIDVIFIIRMFSFFFACFVFAGQQPSRVKQIQETIGTFLVRPYHDGLDPAWRYDFEMHLLGNVPMIIDVTRPMGQITDLAQRKHVYDSLRDDMVSFFNLLYEFLEKYRAPKAELTRWCGRSEKGQAGLTWFANCTSAGLLGSGLASVATYTSIGVGVGSGVFDVFLNRWRSLLGKAEAKRNDLDDRFLSLLEKYSTPGYEPVAAFLQDMLQAITQYEAADWQTKMPRVYQVMQRAAVATPMPSSAPDAEQQAREPLPEGTAAAADVVIDILSALDEQELQQVLASLEVSFAPTPKKDDRGVVQTGWYTLFFRNHKGLPFTGDFYALDLQPAQQFFNNFFVLVTKFFSEYRMHKTCLKAWLGRLDTGKNVMNLTGNTVGVVFQAMGNSPVASGVTLGTGIVNGGVDQFRNRIAAALKRTYDQLPAFDKSFADLLQVYPANHPMHLLLRRMIKHAMNYSADVFKMKLPKTWAAGRELDFRVEHLGHTVVNVPTE